MSKIAFLFPGQGAQSVGMGRDLFENVPEARKLYERANNLLGYDLTKICFEGPSEELDSTVHSQPALFVTSLAALAALTERSPEVAPACQLCAGLSLGEYTAMVFAGVLDFDDGLRLVAERGAAMQDAADATPSGMVSILGLERDKVEELCQQARGEQILQIANLLAPGVIAVSGQNAACERVVELAEKAGAMKVVPLAVAGAFHTPVMQPAVKRLEAAVSIVPMQKARLPVISNVDAQPHTDPEEIRQLLIRQIVSPVRWEDGIRAMMAQGVDEFYEVGPGRQLRGMLRRIDRKINCTCVMD